MKIALFASGNGSNVQAIIDAVQSGKVQAELVALVCDNPNAYVIGRAEQAGIPQLILSPKDCATRMEWERNIVDFLHEKGTQLIVLARFMRIVGESLLVAFPNRILNIHPSLLPFFPGRDGIGDAYRAGVNKTGVTVHWVDAGIDTGPIVRQEEIEIQPNWTLEELEEQMHILEHRVYPETIQQVIEELSKGVSRL